MLQSKPPPAVLVGGGRCCAGLVALAMDLTPPSHRGQQPSAYTYYA
jgi:hypothetical protein